MRFVDEHLRSWATRAGVRVRDTSAGRQFSEGDISYGMLYPSWESLELYLVPIREAGMAEEARGLFDAISGICVSKRLTDKNPNLPTSDLATAWPAFEPMLDRYREARKSAARLRAAQRPQ